MRLIVALAPVLLLAACGSGGENVVARGSVELPEVAVSPMTTGRVIRVLPEQGDVVQRGDTLAILTQSDADALLADQRARVAAASASLRDLEAGARPQEIARAQADSSAAAAESRLAHTDLGRTQRLWDQNATSRQSLDDATTRAGVADERLAAATEALRLMRAGSRRNQIGAARAELARNQATLAAQEARLADLVLVSPVDGVVLSRAAEPGEVLSPGTPALTVGDVKRAYVRAFFPQRMLERLTPGTSVVVHPDGWEDEGAPGRVVSVSPEAEFTPRVALTEQERADQLFGVRIELEDPTKIPAGVWVSVKVRGEK
jgi:HlyD family secretion protein